LCFRRVPPVPDKKHNVSQTLTKSSSRCSFHVDKLIMYDTYMSDNFRLDAWTGYTDWEIGKYILNFGGKFAWIT